jgi:hypothetical protein
MEVKFPDDARYPAQFVEVYPEVDGGVAGEDGVVPVVDGDCVVGADGLDGASPLTLADGAAVTTGAAVTL